MAPSSEPKLLTPHGKLNRCEQLDKYPSGKLRSCVPGDAARLMSRVGVLTPQWETDYPRRPDVPAVEFFEDGALKGVTLALQSPIPTTVGDLQAERLTFYPNGALRRLFPLAGKLSATWTEEDEARHAAPVTVPTSQGPLVVTAVSFCFHESGPLRSVALWNGHLCRVTTSLGEMNARLGISFHESGAIQSLEPANALPIATPIGPLTAYHSGAVGVHGDSNSLRFAEDGQLAGLLTEEESITVLREGCAPQTFAPRKILSRCEEGEWEYEPLDVTFGSDWVALNGERFPTAEHQFQVQRTRGPGGKRLPVLRTSCG